jgi:hypothetical protein
MNRRFAVLMMAALACGFARNAAAQTGFPFQNESLRYAVNLPGSVSLGKVNLTAHRSGQGWEFTMALDGGIPGFQVSDHYRSLTNADGCSLEFERTISHGSHASHDKTTFDYRQGVARRQTVNGGNSETQVPSCAHDALAFLYYARRELGQGRVPQAEQVFYGPEHSIQLQYTGAQNLDAGEKPVTADRVLVYIKGPASDTQVDLFFARDPARTPLSVQVPFSAGTLSLELVR